MEAKELTGDGIDYGPGFDGDVGKILKNRLLGAIDDYREAERGHSEIDLAFARISTAWSESLNAKNIARDRLVNAATAWETWDQQQHQHTPGTSQDGPGTTEGPNLMDRTRFPRGIHPKGSADGEA
jgi:hypothetical protein